MNNLQLLELSSELAQDRAIAEADNYEYQVKMYNSDDDENYSEEFQDIFNKWYDHYFDIINRTINIIE